MRYYLDPHGCAKNQVDAETIMARLSGAGWDASDNAELADLIIVNSCGFIESAKAESIEAVLAFKTAYPDKKLILAGCLSQRYAEDLKADLPEVDLFFGNADLSKVVEASDSLFGKTTPVCRTLVPEIDPSGDKDFALCSPNRPLLSLPGSAYVKITEGCDNRCSFCAIPLIRGSLRSRSVDSVVEECAGLLERGVKELCLIGQDLGSYGKDKTPSCLLPELLSRLSTLKGEFWVRLLYIHPDNFPREILPVMAADPRLLPYFDIPFQHASAPILKAMNRRGNAELYLGLIRDIRAALPDATIRSTFLLGFPGESEEDFEALLDFQQKAKINWLGSFTYSREDDTPAFKMGNRVTKKIARERQKRIEDAQVPISEAAVAARVGADAVILVEEKVEGEEGLFLGRHSSQAPEVDGATVLSCDRELIPGTFVRGRIFRHAGFDLDVAVPHA